MKALHGLLSLLTVLRNLLTKMSYSIPAQRYETLLEIKKSKFYACAGFAQTREDAMLMLDEVKARYPDARHHCWAYLLGHPEQPLSVAMSDDGEPSGTAGKPILNVLQHKPVGNIMMIVTRYFGGIKLGAGGLVRAYSGAAQQTMETLPVITQVKLNDFTVITDFAQEQFIRHWTESVKGKVTDCTYSQAVTLSIAIPDSAVEALRQYEGSLGLTVKAVEE